jgi:hypothetical protein
MIFEKKLGSRLHGDDVCKPSLWPEIFFPFVTRQAGAL